MGYIYISAKNKLWGGRLALLYLFHPSQKKRSSHRRCSARKGVLKNFAKFIGKHLCQSVRGLKAATFLKKTLAPVFSCEFCEIFKNTFFTKHLRATASRRMTSLVNHFSHTIRRVGKDYVNHDV